MQRLSGCAELPTLPAVYPPHQLQQPIYMNAMTSASFTNQTHTISGSIKYGTATYSALQDSV